MVKVLRFLGAGIAAGAINYAVSQGFGYFFSSLYDPSTGLWRAAMTPSWIQGTILASLGIGLVYVAAYSIVSKSLGNRKQPFRKGLKFGVSAWLLSGIIGSIMTYVYMPVSAAPIAVWLISGLISTLLGGLAIAKIYG